jgi:hypothetical protein
MSALKNVIQKNKKTNPTVKPSKFYKPPEKNSSDDIVLPDDVKIELSQDFDAHRSSGNAAERIRDFDRMHPVHGLNSSMKHLCTWCWVPLFGWVEAPVRMAWHLALFLILGVFSIITLCQVRVLKSMCINNLRLVYWYLGALFCCYLPIPCCDAEGWPWYFLEYYFASGCFAACCYGDSVRRSWEVCFPLPNTEYDYPSECRTCCAPIKGCLRACSTVCKCLKKCVK